MSVRKAWRICWWCLGHCSRLLLWSIWLALLLALAGQVHLLSSRRVPVPEPVRRLVVQHLAEHGLRFNYGRGLMDISGHLVLENVTLQPDSRTTPLVSARTVYVRFDPWSLFLGPPALNEVRIDGLTVDQLAERVDLAVRVEGDSIDLSYLDGYVGRLPVHASGRFQLPPSAPRTAAKSSDGDRLAAAWSELVRHARTADAWLAAFDTPALHLRIDGQSLDVTADARAIDLTALPGGPGGMLTGVHAHTVLPLGLTRTTPLTITGGIATLDLPREITARDLAFRLTAPVSLDSPLLELQLASASWRDLDAGPMAATVRAPARGDFTADLSLRLAGGDWRVQGAVTPASGTAAVRLDGFIDDATLAFVGGLIHHDLTELLDPAQPAPLHARATFGPGWKLTAATGRLHSGSVRVGTAQLDETGTEFTYDGRRALADALVLRQGESLAHGSYEMDTATLDFRFLLTGGLRPMGISGWFHSWWTNFWSTFDFSRGLPVADVDVRGRWGDLTATNVFVQADGARIGLRGVAFDRVGTRLYLRPHWFDILHFEVARDGQDARGTLARSLDLQQEAWTRMEFGVESTLPLATIAQLFPAESAELLNPYEFSAPPRLSLRGYVTGPASPEGRHEHIDIGLSSSGPMTYHGFPLEDLSVQARMRDNLIDLPTLSVNFAGGRAEGEARLSGPPETRRLAFDITLAKANLGTVVQTVDRLQPAPATPLSEKAIEAARLRQQRLEGGRLDFSLKAEGAYADFHSFNGTGRGTITNAELGELNLFGPLSAWLRGTFLNFSSFSLTDVEAPFVLEGDRVRFSDLRVSGPSAVLLAKGDYHLRQGELDFTTKIHPFDQSTSLFGSAASLVFTPFSKVLEVKVQGTLSKPSWIFAYGPSRLLNTLTGSETQPPAPPPPPAAPPKKTSP